MRTSSAFETVRCPGCNEPRRISARQARRGITLCRGCRYPPNVQEPSTSGMLWWLRRYDDTRLAEIATDLLGEIVTPDGIARERAILTASASQEDTTK